MTRQGDLFGPVPPARPPGFHYQSAFVTADEEAALLADIAQIPFSTVVMRGGTAKRRTAHYGWMYGYDARSGSPGEPIPEFLLPLRAKAAAWAELPAGAFAEALVTEYPLGAAIGWHRDAPMFGDVIAGISLAGTCRMKFRPYVSPVALQPGAPPRRSTHEQLLERRSAYLISGVARREFEHSIPPAPELRYSITFRTVR